jgi:hypothetical protein
VGVERGRQLRRPQCDVSSIAVCLAVGIVNPQAVEQIWMYGGGLVGSLMSPARSRYPISFRISALWAASRSRAFLCVIALLPREHAKDTTREVRNRSGSKSTKVNLIPAAREKWRVRTFWHAHTSTLKRQASQGNAVWRITWRTQQDIGAWPKSIAHWPAFGEMVCALNFLRLAEAFETLAEKEEKMANRPKKSN